MVKGRLVSKAKGKSGEANNNRSFVTASTASMSSSSSATMTTNRFYCSLSSVSSTTSSSTIPKQFRGFLLSEPSPSHKLQLLRWNGSSVIYLRDIGNQQGLMSQGELNQINRRLESLDLPVARVHGIGAMMEFLKQNVIGAYCQQNVGQLINLRGTSHAGKTYLLQALLERICEELMNNQNASQNALVVINFYYGKKNNGQGSNDKHVIDPYGGQKDPQAELQKQVVLDSALDVKAVLNSCLKKVQGSTARNQVSSRLGLAVVIDKYYLDLQKNGNNGQRLSQFYIIDNPGFESQSNHDSAAVNNRNTSLITTLQSISTDCGAFMNKFAGTRNLHSLVFTDVLAVSIPPKLEDGRYVQDKLASRTMRSATDTVSMVSRALDNFNLFIFDEHQDSVSCKAHFNDQLASASCTTTTRNNASSSTNRDNMPQAKFQRSGETSSEPTTSSVAFDFVEMKDSSSVVSMISPLSAGSSKSFFRTVEEESYDAVSSFGVTEEMKEAQTFQFGKRKQSQGHGVQQYKNSVLGTLLHASIKDKKFDGMKVIDESHKILDALNTHQHTAKADPDKKVQLFRMLPLVWTLQSALNVFERVTTQENYSKNDLSPKFRLLAEEIVCNPDTNLDGGLYQCLLLTLAVEKTKWLAYRDGIAVFKEMLCGVTGKPTSKTAFGATFRKSIMIKSPFFDPETLMSLGEFGAIITPSHSHEDLGLGQKNLRNNYLCELESRIISPFYRKCDWTHHKLPDGEPHLDAEHCEILKSTNEFMCKIWRLVSGTGGSVVIGPDGVTELYKLLSKFNVVHSALDCEICEAEPLCLDRLANPNKILSKVRSSKGEILVEAKITIKNSDQVENALKKIHECFANAFVATMESRSDLNERYIGSIERITAQIDCNNHLTVSIYTPHGCTLSNLITSMLSGRKDLLLTKAMMEKCLEGIRKLHGKLCSHGDLKTENIIVGCWKIFMIDFGEFHTVGPHPIGCLHHTTPLCTAPETLLQQWNLHGPLKDMYSLACSLINDFSGGALLDIYSELKDIREDEGESTEDNILLEFKCIVNRAVHGLWKELLPESTMEEPLNEILNFRLLKQFKDMFRNELNGEDIIKRYCQTDIQHEEGNLVYRVEEAIEKAADIMRKYKVVLNIERIKPVLLWALAPIPYQRPTIDQVIEQWFGSP